MTRRFSSYSHKLKQGLRNIPRCFKAYWRHGWWHKIVVTLAVMLVLAMSAMYGIARWYIASEAHKPLVVGASFIPDFAEYLGLDAKQTMDAMIQDLHIRHFRLVSYWSDIERTKGSYDFTQLDWQFKKAETAHAKVSLSLGLRQPRWPECHMPDWAAREPANVWQTELQKFMAAVVLRYKNSPALESYQVENEYFLKGFGNCTNFDRQRLVEEFNLIKKTDPKHTIIIARSNNALGIPLGQPQPDEFGITVYKRVWDGNLTHRYLEYPFPAWFYAFVAGMQKIVTGRDMVIHELQAEAWPPRGQTIPGTSLAEQNKSINAARLKDRFEYGRATGMRQMDLWGAEYWYYRLVKLHDPSLWNVAQQEFSSPSL